MASTYLTKTPSASNRKTFTISVWIKRSLITSQQAIFSTGNGNSGPLNFFGFGSSDNLNYWEYQDGYTEISDIKTTRVFRDTNAWYHIVLAVDTTQATASNRTKIYVNGVQETALGTSGSNQYPVNQNQDMAFNQADQHAIGRYEYNNSGYFNGCISHFHFIDGTAYTASTFGSTDATTGEWKINTSPSVSYGTNGFFLLKDNNGITDQSGNSNNYVVGGGTLTALQESPSHIFATWNPLLRNDAYAGQNHPTNVNTTFVSGETGTNYPTYVSTLGASSGKYYFECKMGSSGGAGAMIGITDSTARNSYFGSGPQDYGYFGDNGKKYVKGASGATYGNSFGNNDIIGCAVDLDNSKLYFHKNGTYQDSGDPTSGSTGTGAISIDAPSSTNTGFYFFAAGDAGNSDAPTVNANFGNGLFGTTAISSEGTNASSIGKFEYDVPTGYTALSTKGLNE
jgi:hypothetical protein